MINKTYADECLERAGKATEGPWSWYRESVLSSKVSPSCVLSTDGYNNNYDAESGDREFIAHARTDVPELARRLKLAIEILKSIYELEAHPATAIDKLSELEGPL